MPRKNGHSLVAVPNFIHKIHEDRFYALYLEGYGGKWGKKLQCVSMTAKCNSEWRSYSLLDVSLREWKSHVCYCASSSFSFLSLCYS